MSTNDQVLIDILRRLERLERAQRRQATADNPSAIPYGYLNVTQRDKRVIPFDEDTSHYLQAIGSSAVYQAAGVTVESLFGYDTFLYADQYIWQPDESAPALNVETSNGLWTGATRCNDDGATIHTVRCPTSFVVPGGAGTYDNNGASFLDPDGATLKKNQPFARCVAGGIATSGFAFSSGSIYGDGLHGPHGGSDIGEAGTIMPGAFDAGVIPHGMNILLRASRYYYRDTVTPANMHMNPAFTHDNYATNSPTSPPPGQNRGYGGTNPNFKVGCLLALRPDFNLASFLTEPARIIGRAAMDYGFRICDDVNDNGVGITTAWTPTEKVSDRFQAKYGYPFACTLGSASPWALDMKLMVQSLYIVTNDSSVNRGGGGTPRRPKHGPIGN